MRLGCCAWADAPGLLRLGQQFHRRATSVAPVLAARDAALGGLECSFGFAIPSRREDACAIRERGEGFETEVNAAFLSSLPPCRRQGLDGRLRAGATDLPAVCFPAEGDGLAGSLDGARPAHGKTPDRGEDQEALVKPSPMRKLGVGAALGAVTPLQAGVAWPLSRADALKERLEGAVHAQDHLLHDLTVNLGVLGQRLL